MTASKTIKLTNGLTRFLVADILENGEYGDIYEVAKLTSVTADTAEGSVSLAAGNAIIYSKKSVGKTTGSLGFYGMPDDVETKLFDVRKSKTGGKIYGMRANKGYKAVIVEATAVNLETGLEEYSHMIFPKVSLGLIGEEGQTKDADGNETINAKSLSFEALALDNDFRTYKYINSGKAPDSITKDMFEEGDDVDESLKAKVGLSKVGEGIVA